MYKRLYDRFSDKNIKLSLIDEHNNRVYGTSVNISINGICGAFEGKLEKDIEVQMFLEFIFENKNIKIETKSKIVWVIDVGNNESLIGLYILDCKHPYLKEYRDYIAKILEKK